MFAFLIPQMHSPLFCLLQQCDPEKLITESKFLQLESLQELMKVREISDKGLDWQWNKYALHDHGYLLCTHLATLSLKEVLDLFGIQNQSLVQLLHVTYVLAATIGLVVEEELNCGMHCKSLEEVMVSV